MVVLELPKMVVLYASDNLFPIPFLPETSYNTIIFTLVKNLIADESHMLGSYQHMSLCKINPHQHTWGTVKSNRRSYEI